MRLVRRLRGSTVVEVAPPRGRVTEAKAQHILPLHCINDSPYCKLFAANTQQVSFLIDLSLESNLSSENLSAWKIVSLT